MPKWTLLIIVLFVALIGISVVTAQDSTYTLQYGDVLDVIAASFDVSVSCLAEASGIDNPNKVRPGDTLIIDRTCPSYDGLIEIPREPGAADDVDADESDQGGAATTSSSGGGDGYTVQRGDVLDTIAAAFDVDVMCLATANNMADPGELFIGDVLAIDLSCPRYDGEAFVTQPREELALGQGGGAGGSTYFIRVGDYLDRISAQYNIDTACLAEENGLSNPNRIFPGDQIEIVTNCPPYQGSALENLQN
jgi:LysM repeat protein